MEREDVLRLVKPQPGFFARLFGATQKTCGSCKFYDNQACRRNPPQRVYTPSDTEPGKAKADVTVWPIVRAGLDWCGEHRED